MAVEVRGFVAPGTPLSLQCKRCQTAFCFECAKDAHSPMDCEALAVWLKKIMNDDDQS